MASLELQGVILSTENRHAEAITVLISLAEAYQRAGQPDNAIEAYNELLKRHPNTANAYWGLYKVYKQRGNATKAQHYAIRLQQVVQYGDKSLFPIDDQNINAGK